MKTTSDLISDVSRLVFTPNALALGTQGSDILAIANQELSSRIIPLVSSINEEYMVQTIDIPIIPGQSQYRMPTRSVGAKLRDVRWTQGNIQLPLPRIEIERLQEFTLNALGTPVGFWLSAGAINLVPTPNNGALRVRYYTAPRKLVEWNGSTTSSTIGIVGTVTGYYTVGRTNDTVGVTPSVGTFTTPLGKQVDIISSATPYEFLAVDSVVTTTGGSPRVTVPSAVGVPGPAPNLSPSVRPGDVLASGDTSPIVQLPDEVYPLLVTRTAIQMCIQLGDTEKAVSLSKIYDDQEQSILKLLSPRIDGSPRKMNGFLQTSGYNQYYWRSR